MHFVSYYESAIFKSPLYPNNVPALNGLICEWRLTAPPGGYYKITFLDAYTNGIGELKVKVGAAFRWKFRGTDGVSSLVTPKNTANMTVGYVSPRERTTGSFKLGVEWKPLFNISNHCTFFFLIPLQKQRRDVSMYFM